VLEAERAEQCNCLHVLLSGPVGSKARSGEEKKTKARAAPG
jgi:hypothetical protein